MINATNEITESSVKMPDGRTLSYAEFGDPHGRPLIYCHGNPGSRLDCLLFDQEEFLRHHVRVISLDRPGVGGSDFQPRRKLTDWPADVCALADALGLGRFAVLGYSAGGPYAAVCAALIPQRLTAAGIASGVAPLSVPGVTRGMGPGKYFFRAAGVHPWLGEVFLNLMKSGMSSPKGGATPEMPGMPPADQTAMSRPGVGEAFLRSFQAASAPGMRGVAWDAALLARPWGFRVADIGMPVSLWHGEADRNTPLAMARYMAETIPNCRAKFFPGEGHFSLGVNHLGEILAGLFGD
jgi:pimeloyl-ACP methyl ester carboxylesterase